jgi:hypothetical protein
MHLALGQQVRPLTAPLLRLHLHPQPLSIWLLLVEAAALPMMVAAVELVAF